MGIKRRLYVVCRPGHNSKPACLELERQAIERWVRGLGSSSLSLATFIERRFLPEYPASKNLSPAWTRTLEYLLGEIVIPKIGRTPLVAVDAATIARMCKALREETTLDKELAQNKAIVLPDRKLSDATIAGAFKVLGLVLAWAATNAVPPDARFEALAERYLVRCRKELAPATVARVYGYHLRRHLVPILRDDAIGALDDTRLTGLRHELSAVRQPSMFSPGAFTRTGRPKRRWEVARERRRRGDPATSERRLGDQTIRHVVVATKTVLAWAVRLRELPSMPAIPVPKVTRARRAPPYTVEEARALLAAAESREWSAFLLLAFDTGCRKSEALGLTWSQIDFAHHRITFDRQIYRGELRPTKSGKERSVTMPGTLEKRLKEIRHLRGPQVFCYDDGSPWTESHVRTNYERSVMRAGLRKTRWHDHRHAYSTFRTDQGASPFELRDELGHADVKTTQGYVHASTPRTLSVLDEETGT